jgi:D-threonate/D-erythronate kinase
MFEHPVVLADDFTGATELAGVAWRYGLTSEVCTEPISSTRNQIVCYDAHTRHLTANDSVSRNQLFAQSLATLPQFVYKKTDSLLRGHVVQELECLLKSLHKQQALLCPANPQRGRTIVNSHYYVNDQLLSNTLHARDPEYPRWSSHVYELLGQSAANILVPDIVTFDDLQKFATQISDKVLPAGGAEFFEALLQRQGYMSQTYSPLTLPRPWCFVCGSLTGWQNGRRQLAIQNNIPIVQFNLIHATNFPQLLQSQGVVLFAIGEPMHQLSANELLFQFTQQVADIVKQYNIGTLFMEGGATARALLGRMQWTQFQTLGELAPGCVALREITGRSPVLVCKPGSYDWPSTLWEQLRS